MRLVGYLLSVCWSKDRQIYIGASTEGSTVSSLFCDRWLMLDLETLNIIRWLNH